MKMKLETNLPLIFLTLLVISIVVLGYLELKKMNERIKKLEYSLSRGDKKSNTPNVEKTMVKSSPVVPEEVKNKVVLPDNHNNHNNNNNNNNHNNNRVEEWQMNNQKDEIINTIHQKGDYIEEINSPIFLNPGEIYAQHSMMYREMDVNDTDEIINQIHKDETIDFEKNIHDEEKMMNDFENVNNGEIMDNQDKIDNDEQIESVHEGSVHEGSVHEGSVHEGEEIIKVEVEVIDVVVDREEEKEEEEEVIDLKEISQNDDFEKKKIYVDESFSVNELKLICKNLGIQSSGNKTTLITRIMDNQ